MLPRTMKVFSLLALLSFMMLLAGCQADREEACPLDELPYPRPEPDYTGKLERDFTPFADALAAYTPEQAAALEKLVSGQTIPELQALMASGDLTSVDLIVYYLDRIQRYDVDKLNSVLELNPEALEIAQALDDERAARKQCAGRPHADIPPRLAKKGRERPVGLPGFYPAV